MLTGQRVPAKGLPVHSITQELSAVGCTQPTGAFCGDAPPAGLQPQRDAGLQPKEQEKPPKRPQAPFSPDTASSGKAEMLRGEKQSPQSSSFPQLSLSDMLSESMQNAVLRATPHTDEDYFPQGMTSCSIRGCIILQ